MPPEQADTSAAKLFDSFSGFVHLGEDAAEPSAAAETVSTPPEVQETAAVVEPEGVILLSSVDIVEATPEDDPWGTFTEVVEEGDEIHFGEVLEESAEVQPDTSDTVEEIEPFTLMDDESTAGSFGSISLQEEPDVSTGMGISLGEGLDCGERDRGRLKSQVLSKKSRLFRLRIVAVFLWETFLRSMNRLPLPSLLVLNGKKSSQRSFSAFLLIILICRLPRKKSISRQRRYSLLQKRNRCLRLFPERKVS